MTREHLTNTVAKQLKITQIEAYDMVIAVLESIKEGLVKEGKVTL